MKSKFAAVCSAAALGIAAASAPAFAGTMSWNFLTLAGNPAQPGASLMGTSYTFTQGSMSLTANSMTQSGSSWAMGTEDLYAKNGGSVDESGLGLMGDPSGDHEIFYPNGIELTGFSGHVSSVMIGSLQGTATNGESWAVFGSNDGSTWTQLGSGMGGGTEDFTASSLLSYSDLIIAEPSATPYINSNDIVLMGVTTTVPEPGTLALFGAGLLGCALLIARRRRVRQD